MKILTDIPYVTDHAQVDTSPAHMLDLYLPDTQNFPTFLYFHGGGLVNGSKGPRFLGEWFAKNGIAFATANYRMYPTASYPDFIKDAASAVAWVKNRIVDYGGGDRVFVGGSSAGGYLSMMLCFDAKYLAMHKIKPESIAGYIHDAGQPTTHFNVLRERNRFKACHN